MAQRSSFLLADSLVEKLANLNSTQQSIEMLSNWIQFQQHFAEDVVEIWRQKCLEAPPNSKLLFIYVANDVLQRCLKRGENAFIAAFSKVMKECLIDITLKCDDKTKASLNRVLDIWRSRRVIEAPLIDSWKNAMYESASATAIGVKKDNVIVYGDRDSNGDADALQQESASGSGGDGGGSEDILEIPQIPNELLDLPSPIPDNLADFAALAGDLSDVERQTIEHRKKLENAITQKEAQISALSAMIETEEKNLMAIRERIVGCDGQALRILRIREDLNEKVSIALSGGPPDVVRGEKEGDGEGSGERDSPALKRQRVSDGNDEIDGYDTNEGDGEGGGEGEGKSLITDPIQAVEAIIRATRQQQKEKEREDEQLQRQQASADKKEDVVEVFEPDSYLHLGAREEEGDGDGEGEGEDEAAADGNKQGNLEDVLAFLKSTMAQQQQLQYQQQK